MTTDADRRLSAWAADCAERVLATFGDLGTEHRPHRAVAAARAWATGAGAVEECRDAAIDAQLAARDAQDAGYRALAFAVRACAAAAASADDPLQAKAAATLAVEAVTLNSAPCEQQSAAAGERRRQWEALPAALRPAVFGDAEPPLPPVAACAIG